MAMPTLPTQHTQTHTAHTLAPSAAGGPGTTWTHGVKTETYESASPEIKALIRQMNRLAQAQTLEEHQAALQGFDEDVTLDTPFIQVQGRERIRVLATLAKIFLGSFEIEPKLVKITVPEGVTAKGGKLDVDGMVHWLPHRPWYLPLTLLLPKDVPIYADVSLGIKAHNDKVFFVSGKNHNLPHVPRLLRVIAGWVAGMAVSVAEPAVISMMDWYRAGVENVQGARTQIGSGLEGGQHTVGKAAGTIRDTAENVIETAQEKVAQATKAAETFATKVAHTVTGTGTTTTTTPTTTTVA